MKLLSPPLAIAALLSPATAHVTTGRPGHGLIGYGITMYDPPCAFACKSSVPTTLECPMDEHHHGSSMSGHDMGPSPECLTTNEPYLHSLAWCIHTHCEGVPLHKLERYWVMNVAGRQVVQPEPKMSYQEAVRAVEEPPTDVLGEEETLNRTVKVDDETYQANINVNIVFEEVEVNHETYGLVLFISGGAIPIFLSLLRLIPLPASLTSKLNSFIIDPPLFGARHATPLLNLAIVPTRGQSLFILYIVAVNIILSAVGYRVIMPNAWYSSGWYQLTSYIANRTGVLSFANIALLILYSGRNNVLLWLTSWSHTTFLLVHRWVAWMCTLQACVHSALWLALYVYDRGHTEVSQEPFWYWGIIATLALTVLLPVSVLPIRNALYEVFLIAHIALAIMAIVGSWYHIIYRYDHQWGYETWLYMAMAIWAFDRLVRLARMARHGVKRAYVTRIDDDYLRVDIPDVDCRGHIYAYFPSLSWRVWENHPFSVVNSTASPTGVQMAAADVGAAGGKAVPSAAVKEAGSTSSEIASVSETRRPGISLFVRVHKGITAKLAGAANLSGGIPVLLEASYGKESATLFGSHSATSSSFTNTVCIAGGVGVTAVLPSLMETLSLYNPTGTTKLFWGVRRQGLVESVEGLVTDVKRKENSDGTATTFWGGIETHVSVGERLNLRRILEAEIGSSGSMGTTVVVCGPEGMADEVRCIVAGLGRNGAVVRLVEESFMW
ncbi:hypothetical protein ACJ41O_000865 [Fusarium nematophilum]